MGQAERTDRRGTDGEILAQWARVKGRLKSEFGEATYGRWLKALTLVAVNEAEVCLAAPTRFMRDWVATHYGERLRQIWAGERPGVRAIEVVVEADELDENDMVCDFKQVGALIGGFIETFDHAMCLNTADAHYPLYRAAYERVVPFENQDPTSELMARLVFEKMKAALETSPEAISRRVRVRRIRMHETSTSWAEYEG